MDLREDSSESGTIFYARPRIDWQNDLVVNVREIMQGENESPKYDITVTNVLLEVARTLIYRERARHQAY